MFMGKLTVETEVWDATEGVRLWTNEFWTEYETIGDLYRYLTKEYGACVGKLPDCMGWIFRKRIEFRGDVFVREVRCKVRYDLAPKDAIIATSEE